MILTRGFSPSLRGLRFGNALFAVFASTASHRAIRALPLVFIDGARQEPLDIRAFRRDAAADHLGDGSGDHHGRQIRLKRLVRAFHRALGAVLAEFFLRETGDHDGQLVRRQTIGVVQHRGHRQILAADRPVDDHLQPLDRREYVHRSPVAAGAIVIEDEHQIISSALRLAAALASCAA